MRYTFLILATLSYAQTNSMDGLKEKWSNFCERINFSSISNRVSKDACLEKLSSLTTFLNSGLNRLVEVTIRNDNYTTKEKTIIGAGSVGVVASLFGAKYLVKKSRLSKKANPDRHHSFDHSKLQKWTSYNETTGEWNDSSVPSAEKDQSLQESIRAIEYNLTIKRAVNGALHHISSDKTISEQKVQELELLIPDENPMRESLTDAAKYLLEEKIVLARELEKNLSIDWKNAVATVSHSLQKEMRELDTLAKKAKTESNHLQA